ncbi:MAG: mannosyltransferase [Gaiellaceae bacterium]|nr:mannosyltransferase [Gaiellaceae bacterium]
MTQIAETTADVATPVAAAPRGPAAAAPDVLARLTAAARRHYFALGIAACTAAVAAFTLARRLAWPPHEDETLALFVGRGSLGSVLNIVTGERGGAPLHFLFAWAAAHGGGGLGTLRLVSALFAIASVPLIALLCARLTDRTTALVATAIACASWVLLFHGIYGRMYSLFLFTSTLSYLALLRALERGGRRNWILWAIALLAAVSTHPYGALVLGSQALYVGALRVRLRPALTTLGVVAIAALPFWRADVVLAGRFDVGVGGGGAKLGAPLPVLDYLQMTAGDFSVGYRFIEPILLVVALGGLVLLARRWPHSAALALCTVVTPTIAFLAARLGNSTSPESRHLIFVVPFFAIVLALPLVLLARRGPRLAPLLALALLVALVSGEVAWGWHKTPALYAGENHVRVQSREAASEWLARTSKPNDILFGYDPIYLGAWQRDHGSVPRTVVPRADPTLALRTVERAPHPLGRAVWVLDASDTNNYEQKLTIPLLTPRPTGDYEARVFGPFLVVRSARPVKTPWRFFAQTQAVEAVGRSLLIGDSDINWVTARKVLARLRARG